MRISVSLLVGGLIVFMSMSWAQELQWRDFKKLHHCVNVGQEWKAGHPDYTIDYQGNLVPTYSSNPGRWLYRCAAGELVWRDN